VTFQQAKVNLWGNDGGSNAAALIPYVNAASAPLGIGNDAVEEGLIARWRLVCPTILSSCWSLRADPKTS
jgi:hypothetical protein